MKRIKIFEPRQKQEDDIINDPAAMIYSFIRDVLQRFSEVPDQLGMAILSVISGNPLLWAFLMQNLNLEIAKMFVISENPLYPNPVLPKTSVVVIVSTPILVAQMTSEVKKLSW